MLKRNIAYFFIAPAVIVMAILVFYPLINGIYLSFTDAKQSNIYSRIGRNIRPATYKLQCDIESPFDDLTFPANCFRNYIDIVQEPTYEFTRIFSQTVIWTAANIIPHILIGLGLALLLNRKIKGRSIYRVILILPWAVPSYISAFTWRFMYNQEIGFINDFLKTMGIGAVPWLSDPGWAMFAVVLANTWLAVPLQYGDNAWWVTKHPRRFI